jgi:hypothetical protein
LVWKPPKDFNAIAPKFLAKHPEVDPAFIAMLDNQRQSWQDKFAAIRNDHFEHRKPLRPELVANFYNLDQAELLFSNAWRAMEDIAVVLLQTKLPAGGLARRNSRERPRSGEPEAVRGLDRERARLTAANLPMTGPHPLFSATKSEASVPERRVRPKLQR